MPTNNAIDLSSEGVAYYNGSGVFTGIDGVTSGFVLTSNGTNVAPSFKSASSSGAILSINGNSGTATPVAGVITIQNVFGTPTFVGAGSTLTFDVGAGTNTVMGASSWNGTASGANNSGIGASVLAAATNCNSCSGFGAGALESVTSGSANTAVGNQALNQVVTGIDNCALGVLAGGSYTTSESSNICIGFSTQGTAAESNVLRIGNATGTSAGNLSKAFIQGITGNTVSSAQFVTINSSTGQLGVTSSVAVNWTDEAISFAAASGNGYFVTATATATMPASPSQGNTISFIVDAAATLTITGNTGQILRIGAAVSASAGTAVASTQGNSVTFVYRTADTAWIATSVIGTWIVT